MDDGDKKRRKEGGGKITVRISRKLIRNDALVF